MLQILSSCRTPLHTVSRWLRKWVLGTFKLLPSNKMTENFQPLSKFTRSQDSASMLICSYSYGNEHALVADLLWYSFFIIQFAVCRGKVRWKSGSRRWSSFMVWHLETKREKRASYTGAGLLGRWTQKPILFALRFSGETFICASVSCQQTISHNISLTVMFSFLLSSHHLSSAHRWCTSLLMHRLVKHRCSRNGELLMVLGAVKTDLDSVNIVQLFNMQMHRKLCGCIINSRV